MTLIKEGVIFTTFEEARKTLNELKDRYNHPLRVFNSQSVKEANQRPLKAKNPSGVLKSSVSGTNFLVPKVNLAPQDWLLEIYC